MNSSVSEDIITIFKKRKKTHISFTELKKGLPETTSSALSLNIRRATNREIEESIGPHLPSGYTLYKKANRTYLLQKSVRDTILLYIIAYPSLTLSQINAKLPFRREEVAENINELSAQGLVSIRIKSLSNGFGILVIPQETSSHGEDRKKERRGNKFIFKEAYDAISKGRGYVKIFELRRYLSLPQEEFDSNIQSLWDQGVIELQASDPSLLKENERRDSYRDKTNTLRILLTWRGENE